MERLETLEAKEGYILTKVEVFAGAAGIEGELALCVAPKDYDEDAWEASRSAGEWDYWAFLSFITAPAPHGNLWDEGATLTVFFGANTFFDRPLEAVRLLNIRDGDVADDLVFHSPWPPEDEELDSTARALVELLKRELGAIEVARPG